MSFLTRLLERRRLEACGPDLGTRGRPWREVEYCVVDVETTGLDLRRDDIVSYGAVIVRAARVVSASCVYGLVRPTREVSTSSVAIHAVRGVDVAQAPHVSECALALAEMLDGRILVAHAAWIEEALLGRAMRTCGVRLRGPAIDTAALTRSAGLWPRHTRREPSLEALSVQLGLPVHTPHHALGDALTTAQVFLALATRLESSDGVRTVQDLVGLSEQDRNR